MHSLNLPLLHLLPTHPPYTHPPHYWTYFPNNPSAFKRQPLIQKVLGVKWGEENCAGLAKGEGRGRGAGFSFPLNCPTWLSVLSLNKHSHFLLTAHIGTQTQAGTHPHKHTPIGCTGTVELHHTKTSMCTHTHTIHCIPWRAVDNTCSLALQPVNSQLSLHTKTPQDCCRFLIV